MTRVKEPLPPTNALSIKSRRRLKKVFTADDLLFLTSAVVDGSRYELLKENCTKCLLSVRLMGL